MTEIEDVIQGFDKNIEFLEKTEKGITEINIRGLLIDLFGTMRDMWEKFANVFEMVEKLNEIEKGQKYEEKIDPNNQDLKSLYL